MKRLMFHLVIDENRVVVTPKMTLKETFMTFKVAPLVYIGVYVGSKAIFFPV